MRVFEIIQESFEADYSNESSTEKLKYLLQRLHAILMQFEQKTKDMSVNHDYLAVDIISLEKLLSYNDQTTTLLDISDLVKEINTTIDMYMIPSGRLTANDDERKQHQMLQSYKRKIREILINLEDMAHVAKGLMHQ
jgi:hypothetical protein